MTDHTLRTLGLDDVALLDPLLYPGRPVAEAGLLLDDEYLPLRVEPGPLGRWPVTPADRSLDMVLRDAGQPPVSERVPVIAVGSNASPGQVRHKFIRDGLPVAVPMVPVRISGIAVGSSAHISPAGYVAAAPYADPDASTTLVVGWFDTPQLAAMDATEFPAYRRIVVRDDEFPMALPYGDRLAAAHLYISAYGVLAPHGHRPRPSGDQRTLLGDLIAASDQLRELLGPDPNTWITTAAADHALRDRATHIFTDQGWVLRQNVLLDKPDAQNEAS